MARAETESFSFDSLKNLAIDLSGVEYMSSAGLRVLLVTYKALKAADGEIVLINPRENVSEVLELSGFTGIFKIVGNIGELD